MSMSRKISFCALAVAISDFLLILTTVFTANRLFFSCVATLAFPVIVVYFDKKTAVTSLAAASIMAFIFLPNKFIAAFYTLLSIYSIVKSIIEKLGVFLIEWAVKLAVYFVFSCIGSFVVFGSFVPLPVFAGAFIFIIYDVVLSFGIGYCTSYIDKFMHRKSI